MNNEQFITDGKDFFIAFETQLVSGFLPVPIPKVEPCLYWHGPKIDLVKSWYPALKFMADHVDHEVVLRLFMTRSKDEIWIFPLTQIYGTGMSVNEEITKEEREWWASEGLIEAGTVHSHCTGGAFASGTDKADERRRDGLHLTVGKLNKAEFDLHARMTWTIPGEEKNGKLIRASVVTTQPPNLRDWFVLPDHAEAFIMAEPELEANIVNYLLCKPPDFRVEYPEIWKTKLLRRPQIQHPSGPFQGFQKSFADYGQFSMAADIPEDYKKKDHWEKNQSQSLSQNEITASIKRRNLLWDLWSEALSIIADNVSLRHDQISVDDFDPQVRPLLIKQHPEAAEVWASIQDTLNRNGVTPEEFFKEWGNR